MYLVYCMCLPWHLAQSTGIRQLSLSRLAVSVDGSCGFLAMSMTRHDLSMAGTAMIMVRKNPCLTSEMGCGYVLACHCDRMRKVSASSLLSHVPVPQGALPRNCPA
ncbi:hypothetical protein C8R47DRAFT_563853 [Mycena vitilis]|nr:hypothetical protein C8R47DRAFT_563853 [Mycena vitilis]